VIVESQRAASRLGGFVVEENWTEEFATGGRNAP